MNGVALVRDRIAAVGAGARALIEQADGLDWASPVLPGANPLGFTLWHLPRSIDWIVNTSIRGAAEVVDRAEFAGLPDPDRYGFGTGLSADDAATVAASVDRTCLLAYSTAVHAVADEWLATLSDTDLDVPAPGFDERQHRRPAYARPEALAEIPGFGDFPIGVLLLRPAISHQFRHMGELDVLIQQAKR